MVKGVVVAAFVDTAAVDNVDVVFGTKHDVVAVAANIEI